MVMMSDGPLLGHLQVQSENSGSFEDHKPGFSIEFQAATSTHLRFQHLTLDGRNPTCPAPNDVPSTRWPVLFLQNPSDPEDANPEDLSASGCISAYWGEDGSLVGPFAFAIPENGTIAWEIGVALGSLPCEKRSYSLEVDTREDCGSGKGGRVVGVLYTFDGRDWDIGRFMSRPIISEIPVQR
jgi:hypothetical protein